MIDHQSPFFPLIFLPRLHKCSHTETHALMDLTSMSLFSGWAHSFWWDGLRQAMHCSYTHTTNPHTHIQKHSCAHTWAHTQHPVQRLAEDKPGHTPGKMCAMVQISQLFSWTSDGANFSGSHQKWLLMTYTRLVPVLCLRISGHYSFSVFSWRLKLNQNLQFESLNLIKCSLPVF